MNPKRGQAQLQIEVLNGEIHQVGVTAAGTDEWLHGFYMASWREQAEWIHPMPPDAPKDGHWVWKGELIADLDPRRPFDGPEYRATWHGSWQRDTLLERTIAFAATAHAGQVDLGGHPYILHPLRVMVRMQARAQRLLALVHDVVEDCGDLWTADRVAAHLGLDPEIRDGLDAITRRPGEAWDDYIARVAQNELARQVKLGDLEDNMDLSRLSAPTERDHKRRERYVRARNALAMVR